MRVAVICIGNELLLDEGVGPACGRYLVARYELPSEVEVLDRAVMGMAIISDLRRCDVALVLDAVEVPGAEPGVLFSFAPDDAMTSGPATLSLHEMRFADVLAAAELMGVRCQGHCLGIQVENMSPTEFAMGLTPRVAAAVPLLAAAAARWLRTELGLPVRDRLGEVAGLSGAADGASDVPGAAGEADPVVAAQVRAELPMPPIAGEPDVSVMTRYLAAGLRAVGAVVCEERVGGASDGTRGIVACAVPGLADGGAVELAALAARLSPRVELGLAVAGGADGSVELELTVRPDTIDHDCDLIISAVRDLIRA